MRLDKQSSVCNVLENTEPHYLTTANQLSTALTTPKSSDKAVRVTDKIKATVFVFFNKYGEKIKKEKRNFTL